jgi:hypothetical protein
MSRRRARTAAFAKCAARWCWRNSSDTRAAHRPTPAPWRSTASALATLDGDPGLGPDAHAFIFDKAPWFTVTDNLPQYPARIPGRTHHTTPDRLIAAIAG